LCLIRHRFLPPTAGSRASDRRPRAVSRRPRIARELAGTLPDYRAGDVEPPPCGNPRWFGHDRQGGDQRFMDLGGARFGLLMKVVAVEERYPESGVRNHHGLPQRCFL
jgi:hypothetical protein